VTPRKLEVVKGKTGRHISRPIWPEWVERWNLTDIDRPDVQGRTFRDYGQRTYRQFQRYGVPFNPYDLRHAYAIRGSVMKGMPSRVMAGMMGHSEAVHSKTYNRWLKEATADEVYDRLID
jgi:integrase